MSKNFLKELKNTKNQIILSKREQNVRRNRLAKFIQKNSVIKNNQISHSSQKAINFLKFNSLTKNFMSNFKLSYLAIPVILIMGAGISFAAENSLPGDFLYPVKIHVNEPVETALSVSPKSQADLNANLAQRRLKEAEQLLSQGKLSPQVKESLSNNFKTHSDSFNREVAKLKEQNDTKDADQAESDFEDNLKSHEAIMGSLGLENALKQNVEASSTATTKLDNLKADFENGKTPDSNKDNVKELRSEDQQTTTSDITNSHELDLKTLKPEETKAEVDKSKSEVENAKAEVDNTSDTQLRHVLPTPLPVSVAK